MNYMDMAIKMADINETNNYTSGGPFGACIVKDGEIISKSSNTVLKDNDPTAHAEVNAIREACRVLNTHDLKGCTLYTSCYPCPMCLSAIIWANIEEVYYANTKEDADSIGFRDGMIYDFIRGKNKDILKLSQEGREKAIISFDKFSENKNREIY